MNKSETMTALRQETFAAEPDLDALIELTADLMLSPEGKERVSKRVEANDHTFINSPWFNQYKIKSFESSVHKKKLPPVELKNILVSQQNVERIEKLGSVILDEAFECLGDEAILLVDAYKKCDENDADAKVHIINRIINLVEEISNKAELPFTDEDDRGNYPPVRISPKLIGRLPNPQISPTCLGKSILTASFFHKCNTPMLHGGIVMSKTEASLINQAEAISSVLKHTEENELNMSPNYRADLKDIFEEHKKTLTKHRGFHAATYVRLNDEYWVQIDPNYGSVLVVGDDNYNLDKVWQSLDDHSQQEVIGIENHSFVGGNIEYIANSMLDKLPALIPSSEKLEKSLLEVPPEEMYATLISELFYPFILNQDQSSDKNLHDFQNKLKSLMLGININIDKTIQNIISSSIYQSFLGEEQPDLLDAFKLFQSDTQYRNRCLNDLQVAPLVAVLKIQSCAIVAFNEIIGESGMGHAFVDMGLPEYRIGISVLSDVAVYYGDELPLSTWLGYWPSKVSLFEHIDQVPSKAQQSLKHIAVKYALEGSGSLTNPSIMVTLKDILEEKTSGEMNGEGRRR